MCHDCSHCNNTDSTTFRLSAGKNSMTVINVPCHKADGEEWLDDDVAKKLEEYLAVVIKKNLYGAVIDYNEGYSNATMTPDSFS